MDATAGLNLRTREMSILHSQGGTQNYTKVKRSDCTHGEDGL